jgi:transposase
MTNKLAFPEVREQAIALRRTGKSRREIKVILGIGSNWTLNEALRGEPPQPWTRRPNAKDDGRARARKLREEGLNYAQIASELSVSKSSISLWVRDPPRPVRGHLTYEESRRRQADGVAKFWAAERLRREAVRAAISVAATEQIGQLTDREVIIAGAIAYWCEGGKNKPYRRKDRVDFINSDPLMIKFFLRFLKVAGIESSSLIFGISIHESADVSEAERFWLAVTGADLAQFTRPVLKRHNPKTVRKNTGVNYHGCLRVQVRRSTSLYRKIEGWARAAMMAPEP